jgi:hypothetical protein
MRSRYSCGKRPNRVLDLIAQDCLLRIVTDCPWLYLDEIQEKLFVTSGHLVHISTIHRCIKTNLRWTLKQSRFIARQRDEVMRALHTATLSDITDDPRQFIFVDESAKNRYTTRRMRSYQPKGNNHGKYIFYMYLC